MSIAALMKRIPDFAKDVRLNLSSMGADETLSDIRKYGLFIACGVTSRNPEVCGALQKEAAGHLGADALAAARAAAAIMSMNNVYYRFVHLSSNTEYRSMPARLRMNTIANPGVDKLDFEFWSLAVSAMNGCGACIDAHERELRGSGVSPSDIQTAIRFAAIIQSAAIAVEAGC